MCKRVDPEPLLEEVLWVPLEEGLGAGGVLWEESG